MELQKYLIKYKITKREFARRCGIDESLIWHYIAGRRKPSQKTAEIMEEQSDGVVTVLDSRGKDARKS